MGPLATKRARRTTHLPLVMSVFLLTLVLASVSLGPRSTASGARPCIDTNPLDAMIADPVSAVGHGVMLSPAGHPIEVTPRFVLEAQRYYLRTLLHQADARQRARFPTAQKHLLEGTTRCDQPYQVYANSALLAWLIDNVKPDNALALRRINTGLVEAFAAASGSPSAAAHVAPSPRTLGVLTREGMRPAVSAANVGGAQYVAQCRAAGVPIPPDPLPTDWTASSVGSWLRQGRPENQFRLDPNFLRGESSQAYVFTYASDGSNDPPGLCIALPRTAPCADDPSGSTDCIGFLGIICQGTGINGNSACFWDNRAPSGPRFQIAKGAPKILADFAGGPQLNHPQGDVCTQCHAGENAFLVHPGSGLDQGALLRPTDWYKPLVHPDWPQNPGPTALPLEQCIGCHRRLGTGGRFPQMSVAVSGYCSILRNAVTPVFGADERFGRTMPPPPFTLAAFQEDIKRLTACNETPGLLARDDTIILGNSPALSFSPCFGPGESCPVKKTVSFMVPAPDLEVFVKYDLGQSHGCCADHAAGLLRIRVDGSEVHRDQIPYMNYGVVPISQFLEDFDFFFPQQVVKGYVPPTSQLDPTRMGPPLVPGSSYKIVRRLSVGKLASGRAHTVELEVGDAGWNSILEVSQ